MPTVLEIAFGPKRSDAKGKPDAEPEEDGDRMLDAAEELVDGVKAGDADAVKDAIRALFRLCQLEE